MKDVGDRNLSGEGKCLYGRRRV